MGVVLDDLYDHERYVARRLADGTLTRTWSSASAAFEHYVPCCRCGWHGGGDPPTEEGYEAASMSGRSTTPSRSSTGRCPTRPPA